jgi:23S rRNA pseudouridine2605 synthase
MERLQKILAHGGIASRRAAESLITSGRVRVNGRVVTELGAKADPRKDRVEVDGKRVVAEQSVYVALHKPRGVVSTMHDPEGRPTVRELLTSLPGRIYPVGRLDFATSGILLATNDGEFADGLLHPRRAVPKTYVVKVKGAMEAEDLERWRTGVRLEDGVTLPAEAKLLRREGDKTWFELTIREGRNQQIRRMGEATRFPVMRLSRVAFGKITLEGLPPGRWRYLTREELFDLKKEFGVPRTVVSPPEDDARAERRRPFAVRGSRGREQRGFGKEAADGGEGRGGGGGGRGQGRGQGRGEGSEQTQPRYGGGAPGRRGYHVTEDWGGGAGRGRSSRGDDDRRPREELGGRGGRTRTTGTGGGIGARGEDVGGRVKGRRGDR